ncbi:MAG: hypothetical protein HY649_07865 [Acidobacteria bacterium]|nr:hypothetical protein [Acidobacteriota bacterium]
MRRWEKVSGLGAYVVLTTAAILGWVAQPAMAGPDSQEKIKGRYAFRMTPVKSFTADAAGDPGGLSTAPRQDILRVGFFTADGMGNLAGRTIATTDTNTGDTWIVTFNWTGQYSASADGTGFFSIDDITDLACTQMTGEHTGATPHPTAGGGLPMTGNILCTEGIEGHEDYAFVFTARGGKSLEFIQTDNAGGGAKIFMTGVAAAQEAFGNHEENDEEDDDQAENQGRDR